MRSATQIQAEIDRLKKELDAIPARPAEPADHEPAVIFFRKAYSDRDKVYDYTAIRTAKGQWWITGSSPGRNPDPRDWDSLMDFVEQGERQRPEIWLATQLERLT